MNSSAAKSSSYKPDPDITADGFDPVLEVFKADLDFTLTEKNLRLTTEERALQLSNATRFLRKFRPLVAQAKR